MTPVIASAAAIVAASAPADAGVQTVADAATFFAGFLTGFWFWPVVILALICLGISAGKGSGLFSTIFLVITGTLLAYGIPATISWVIAHPIILGVLVITYFAGAVVWARVEWSRFIYKKRETFVTYRDKFLQAKNLTTEWFATANYETDYAEAFVSGLRDKGFPNIRLSNMSDQITIATVLQKVVPQASDSKADIIMWMIYWPVLVIWFVVADMLGEIFQAMYRRLAGHFQGVSDKAFHDVAPATKG